MTARADAADALRPIRELGAEPPQVQPAQHHAWVAAMQHVHGNRGAATVLRKTAPVIQRACTACAAKHDDDNVIRRDPVPGTAATPAVGDLSGYLRSSAQTGRPLDASVRGSFETSFGVPLDRVRVITDDGAARAAETLGARAFTLGSSIWFGRGEYRPGSPDGRHLLAHEVAHTVQQGLASPTIQRELVVGSSRDPAEASADAAADAVIAGEQVAMASAAPVIRRECSSGAGRSASERRVTCGDKEYFVTRTATTTTGPRVPRTRFNANYHLDRDGVSAELEICRGGTDVRLTPEVRLDQPLDEAATTALNNVLARRSLLDNLSVIPGTGINITQSRLFDLRLHGSASFDGGTGRFSQLDVSSILRIRNVPEINLNFTYTPGGPFTVGVDPFDIVNLIRGRRRSTVREVDCSQPGPDRNTFAYNCQLITPGQPEQPAEFAPQTTHVFLLFTKATDHVRGWIIGDNNSTLLADGAQTTRDQLAQLAAQGFRATSILGMTSPEGPVDAAPGFQGNQRLSEQRATAAVGKLQADCPTCGAASTVTGIGETFPEFIADKGKKLDTETTAAFLGDTHAPDPLRPADPAAFARANRRNLPEAVYALLRRAQITLERQVKIKDAVPAVPESPTPIPDCPPEVIATAERAFGGARP
jgi:hypothetical protein